MAAGLIVPISGPYLGSWNALPFGTQNDDGFIISATIQGQEVNESDAYGLTLVEAIYRGQNWRLTLRGLEWNKAGLLDSLQMFGQPLGSGSFQPILANIGDRWTKFCQQLVLTAILANPPSFPFSITAVNAGIAPNSQSSFMFTSKLREMPLEFVLIPYQKTISSVPYNLPFSTM